MFSGDEVTVQGHDIVPEQRKIVTDGRHFTRCVVDGLHSHPSDFTFTLDFASIGLGLPMGIGTSTASSDHVTITVCGDARLMMSIQELETAAHNEIPLILIVFNDDSLGSEYHSLDARGVAPEVAFVDAPEFVSIAESVGAAGHTVHALEELAELTDVLSSEPGGPVVIDCKINPYVRHRSKT